MCRWCERSPIADQLTAGLSLPARREFSADPDAAGGGGPGATPAPTIVFQGGDLSMPRSMRPSMPSKRSTARTR